MNNIGEFVTAGLSLIAFIVGGVVYIKKTDKRVGILESNTLNKQDFYNKIDEVKDSISTKIETEIEKCRRNSCNQ